MNAKQFKEVRNIIPDWLRKIKRLYNRIITVCQFAKLGWNDYWFDGKYIEDILIFKLRQMSKRFREDGHLQGSEECAKEMEFVADTLEEARNLETTLVLELESEYNVPEDIFTFKDISEEDGVESKWTELVYTEEYETFLKTKKGKEYEKKRSALFKLIPKKELEMRKKAYLMIAEKVKNWWD